MAITFHENNHDTNGVILNTNAGGQIIVTAFGEVSNPAGDAFALTNANYDLKVDGLVLSQGFAAGIKLGAMPSGSPASKIVVGSTGYVQADYSAIQSRQGITVTNAGRIDGGTFGINVFDAISTITITNTGVISGAASAISVYTTEKVTVTNKGLLDGGISSLYGTLTITNTGTITNEISLGELGVDPYNDTLVNKGTILGNVSMGDGNDKLTNSGSIISGAPVSMGAGDDIYTGSKREDYVRDEAGKDNYKLGAGDDVFTATGTGAAETDGIGKYIQDTVDGGTNGSAYGDTYDASGATTTCYINLDTRFQGNQKANTAGGDSIGFDIVKNFENANGGSAGDALFGTKGANVLNGNGGNDYILGLEGNDTINGGDAQDQVYGGLGADQLNGGSNDGDADVFVYIAATESTLAMTGRDTVSGFEDGVDKFWLDSFFLDATSTVSEGDAFNGLANELDIRVLHMAFGWTIQVDVNGDRKADMAIDVLDVTHGISWSIADFILTDV